LLHEHDVTACNESQIYLLLRNPVPLRTRRVAPVFGPAVGIIEEIVGGAKYRNWDEEKRTPSERDVFRIESKISAISITGLVKVILVFRITDLKDRSSGPRYELVFQQTKTMKSISLG
jgi:hypothetical protein